MNDVGRDVTNLQGAQTLRRRCISLPLTRNYLRLVVIVLDSQLGAALIGLQPHLSAPTFRARRLCISFSTSQLPAISKCVCISCAFESSCSFIGTITLCKQVFTHGWRISHAERRTESIRGAEGSS